MLILVRCMYITQHTHTQQQKQIESKPTTSSKICIVEHKGYSNTRYIGIVACVV